MVTSCQRKVDWTFLLWQHHPLKFSVGHNEHHVREDPRETGEKVPIFVGECRERQCEGIDAHDKGIQYIRGCLDDRGILKMCMAPVPCRERGDGESFYDASWELLVGLREQ